MELCRLFEMRALAGCSLLPPFPAIPPLINYKKPLASNVNAACCMCPTGFSRTIKHLDGHEVALSSTGITKPGEWQVGASVNHAAVKSNSTCVMLVVQS